MKTNPDFKKRGKAFKTLLLDAIRDESLLEVKGGHAATNEEVERAYVAHLARRAFDATDKDSIILLRETLNKTYPGLKATMPTMAFDLPDDATPLQKADAILKAVSEGAVPPDVGAMLVQAAKNTIDIEMATDIKERIRGIEESLGINV